MCIFYAFVTNMPKHLTLSDQEATYFFPPLKLKTKKACLSKKQRTKKEQNQKPNDVNYASIVILRDILPNLLDNRNINF